MKRTFQRIKSILVYLMLAYSLSACNNSNNTEGLSPELITFIASVQGYDDKTVVEVELHADGHYLGMALSNGERLLVNAMGTTINMTGETGYNPYSSQQPVTYYATFPAASATTNFTVEYHRADGRVLISNVNLPTRPQIITPAAGSTIIRSGELHISWSDDATSNEEFTGWVGGCNLSSTPFKAAATVYEYLFAAGSLPAVPYTCTSAIKLSRKLTGVVDSGYRTGTFRAYSTHQISVTSMN